MAESALYILIPAYNEGRQFPIFLSRLRSQVGEAGLKATFVVIDDGSTDGSTEGVTDAKGDTVVLLKHEHNRGVAAALESGIFWLLEKVDRDAVAVVLEADGTNDAGIIQSLSRRIGDGYDVAIGSRMATGGGMRGFPTGRTVVSRLGNLAMRFFVGCPGVRDYTIFFRAYRLGALRSLAASSNGTMFDQRGFSANAELLLKLVSAGARVTEVPHLYRYDLKRSDSKMRIGTTILGYLQLIRRFREPIRTALIQGRTI